MAPSFAATTAVLILSSVLLAQSESAGRDTHPFFAARCIGRGIQCGRYDARYSGSCKAKTKYWVQPKQCINFACGWCSSFKGPMPRVCKNGRVKDICSKSGGPAPKPPPPQPGQPKQGRCEFDNVWRGTGDNVVIDLGRVPLVKGWDYVKRDGYHGIIFARSPARGISPPGRYGRMCFKVAAPQDGKYYFTAISYAPHVTEHNDVWVGASKGFELWQAGRYRRTAPPGTWLKAYQNNGKKGISEHFKTIDFDGHRFLIPRIKKGEVFEVCIAGRSKKYEMFRLILKKCEGMYCKGKIKSGEMLFGLKPSKCYER